MGLCYFVSLCSHILRLNRASDHGDASDQNSADDILIENAQIFSYGVLKKAANNFRKESKIGEGRFGPVYKGKLKTGQIVAVKMLNVLGEKGDREFLNEIIMLSLLCHPNIVNLIGFSAERVERLLVYEYMPLRSLDHHLHDLKPGSKPLDWETRMTIAWGIGEGLNYLHNEANPSVIFGDLKTSNILLDEGFHPRLSSFGLAKFAPMGDMDYTKKCDSYAFGLILLELITGRRPTDISGGEPLFDWRMYIDRKKVYGVVDPVLKGQYKRESLCKAAEVAQKCLHDHESRCLRGSMCAMVQVMKIVASEAKEG